MGLHFLVKGCVALGATALLTACVQPAGQVLYAPNDCAYVADNYGSHAAVDHFSKGSPVYQEGLTLACDMGGQ